MASALRLAARMAGRGASLSGRLALALCASTVLRGWRLTAGAATALAAGAPLTRRLVPRPLRAPCGLLATPTALLLALELALAVKAPGDRRALRFWRKMMPIFTRYVWTQRRLRGVPPDERHRVWERVHTWGGERVHQLVLDMSGFYVKSAQVVASKGEFMPSQWTEALSVLFDQHPPRPYAEVLLSIVEQLRLTELSNERELRVEDAFESLDSEALAAASIGQVHLATLSTEIAKAAGVAFSEVVVKVQHRGLERLIRADLANLRRVAHFLGPHLPLDIVPIAEESLRQIPLEFDFNRERRMQQHVKRSLADAGFKGIFVPVCVDALSSERLLVMERVHGVPLSTLLREQGAGTLSDKNAALLERVPAAMEELLRSYGHALFVDGTFHADPHAGNLMMMDDGRLALLDFGQTKELLPETRALFASLVEMLAEGDEDTIRDAMAAAGLDVSVKADADEADGDTSSASKDVSVKADADEADGDTSSASKDMRDKAIVVAYILFDTRAESETLDSPFAQGGLAQRVNIAFDPQMWMVMRFVLLLRGVLHAVGMDVSACELWQPYARAALDRDADEAESAQAFEAEDAQAAGDNGGAQEGGAAVTVSGAPAEAPAADTMAVTVKLEARQRPPSAREMLTLRALARWLIERGLPHERSAIKALFTAGVTSRKTFERLSEGQIGACGGVWAEPETLDAVRKDRAGPEEEEEAEKEEEEEPVANNVVCGCFGGS